MSMAMRMCGLAEGESPPAKVVPVARAHAPRLRVTPRPPPPSRKDDGYQDLYLMQERNNLI